MSPVRPASATLGASTLLLIGLRLDLAALALTRLGVLGAALGVLVSYDLRERRIPNRIVGAAIVLCAILSAIEGVRPARIILGASIVASLLLLALARPAWIGMGDVKLALLMLCGLHRATPLALLLGIEFAALVAVARVLRRGRPAFALALPLAPFMAAGSLLALLL